MENIIAEIIQTEDKYVYKNSPYPTRETTTKEFKIEKPTLDELFTYYFKEYSDRYKYCNDIHFKFKNPIMQENYIKWIRNIHNYYKAGGDMW